ncbi:MAG: rRNA maturation RNase YbeY [Flavisolibacter sp.]|nr:rRNA maturation RNase YbeY [Flavisolibacter sp.]
MSEQITKSIHFHYTDQSFYLPRRTDLKKFILQIFKMEGCAPEEINYIFCSDDYLFNLNNTYLKHKTYTDIITFQYSWPPQLILSDIYISVERVRENAKLYNTSFLNELYRVIFHGALHLCGYKDKSKKDELQMRSKENFYLSLYVPRGIK